MKILYVDTSIEGHHVPYLKSLIEINRSSICYLPKYTEDLPEECQIVEHYNYKNLKDYLMWMKSIYEISKKEHVDTIHFLYGDIFYRFFGLGLGILRKYHIIITFHHFRKGFLRDISLKLIFKKINIGIVHTEALLKYAYDKRIRNIKVITYPVFEKVEDIGKKESCAALGLSDHVPTLLCFGGTRKDKGLDILLAALHMVKEPVQLVVAGKAEYFSEKYVIEELKKLGIKYSVTMRFIEEKEVSLYFSACDIVVLPYRRIFDGASGPLGIGCVMRKMIVGPSHGSIGRIINDNHLGDTFEAENKISLASIITKSLKSSFVYDEIANEYCEKLSVNRFKKEYSGIY